MAQTHLPLQKRRRFATARSIYALMLREMATTYGKAFGGYMWTIAEPVFGIALLSFVFSLAFRSPSLGTNFAIFFASGYLPFAMYQDVAKRVAGSITYSRSLLVYPSVTFTDAILARVILAMITQVVVFYLIITGIMVLFETETTLDYRYIIGGMCMAAMIGFGVGCLNCFLWNYFPVWQRIWNIITRPMFILSGVIFIYEDVPKAFQSIIWYNPIIHSTGLTRRGFYATYEASFVSPVYVYGISMGGVVIGLFLLYFFHRRILNIA